VIPAPGGATDAFTRALAEYARCDRLIKLARVSVE
jgi:tripartite-type tricarboxylate transporter receptor subunit TctC